ncbi:MAG: type II secretion system GspH family protein [Fimbriimonadaceae bacterium]|nr:type II secretion system protein [Chthonomonadaceae bacterium]MCO5295847.1 type II secretion system GspH family protein [Fimbriimonadaceae bacterium]
MRRAGFTLVSTMITLVIILGLAVFFLRGTGAGSSRADGLGKTVPGAVRAKALDSECQNQLSQIRQSMTIFTNMGEDPNPESLAQLKLGSSFERCPVGKEPYVYDPATGKVRCAHPGHGGF